MNRIRVMALLLLILGHPAEFTGQETNTHRISIEEMFVLAETNSKSIRIATLAGAEAREGIKTAKNARLPSLDLSLSASYLGNGWIADRDFSNGESAPMPHLGNNLAIEVSQVIYAGGVLSNGVAQAKLQHKIALLSKENNRQEIRLLLAGNYLELYRLRNETEVYRKNIDQTLLLLSQIKARREEGLALRNDITRYELQLKSLELELIRTENSAAILNNQLITVLGLPGNMILEIDTCVLENLPLALSETEWQQTALEQSPLLQQARLGTESSRYTEKIVRSERIPSVTLFAGNHLDGPITIEVPPINSNFNYWYAGAGINFNIAATYKTRSRSRQARIATAKAAENELLLRDDIRTNIKAAYIRYTESFILYDTRLKSLELARQNYAVIQNRYLNELALITDMLDASTSKLNAELQVANAKINILFNYYQLKKTAGNL